MLFHVGKGPVCHLTKPKILDDYLSNLSLAVANGENPHLCYISWNEIQIIR